jgi:hypothetical protein
MPEVEKPGANALRDYKYLARSNAPQSDYSVSEYAVHSMLVGTASKSGAVQTSFCSFCINISFL